MKQNEWFEATSRIAEQYITEAMPKRLQNAGNNSTEFRLTEELPDVRSRQSRITRWVTTGFATAAALAVVIGGGVLINKMRSKVPTKPGESNVTTAATVSTETTEVNGSFQQGHEAGVAAAKAAVAAGSDRVIFSGTVTDQVQGIYDDSQDSEMKYVVLGRPVAYDYARIIHVSRTMADSLEVGKFYRFEIDEQITETNPSVLKENRGLPALKFRSAEAVETRDDYTDDISFRRAETDGNTSGEYLRGYQEGYRDLLLNLTIEHNYCRLSGSLTAYVRDVLNPELGDNDDTAHDFARVLVIAESPDHKSFFPVYYPYKNRAELVKDQLTTFVLTPNEENALNQAQYLSDRLLNNVNPSEVQVIFDSVRAVQAGEETNWNRLSAKKEYEDDLANTTTHTDEPDDQTETKTWEMGDVRYLRYINWTALRSGSELHLENFNEAGSVPYSAELDFSGSTAVTRLKQAKKAGELYTEAIPASDGEKFYVLKDGQVISTDGSTVLMTGIRTEVNQYLSLYTVDKLRDGCWFVRISEGWENGGGWVNEYWCDGKGKTVKIEEANTPAYETVVAPDGSCVYFVEMYGNDTDGITRVNPFEAAGKMTVKGDAVHSVKPDGEGPDGCYIDVQQAFFCGGNLYLPLGANGDGSDAGYIVVDPEGGKTPYYLNQPAELSYLFEAGGKAYGITGTGVLAEYLPETNKSRKVADIRAAFAAAAKDGANADLKQDLTELSGSWMPWNNNYIIAVWDDAVVLNVNMNDNYMYMAVNLQTGAVQLLH